MDYNATLLTAESKERLKHVKATNTMRCYSSDWKDFSRYCERCDLPALPTQAETIVNYINELSHTLKTSTIIRRVTSISEKHKEKGYTDPTKFDIVQATVKAIKRENGVHQEGKKPLLLDTLQKMLDTFTDDAEGIRDKALITLGFAGAFRRSELVAIRRENIEFTEQGMTIFVPRSKTDQEGRGVYKGIPYAKDPSICPVRATLRWIEKSCIRFGYLFRGFTPARTLRRNPLSSQMVAVIVKKHLEAAGINSKDYSGHSLRSGFVTTAALKGVSVPDIMSQTNHKSVGMVSRYIRKNVFDNNPLSMIY